MPLPSSGAISISQIRTELGTSSGSLRTLSSLAGKSTPDAMSEFYGYSAALDLYFNWTVPSSGVTCYNYYTFGAYVISNDSVNTNVTVIINWYGDLGGFMQGSVTVSSGTACGVNYYVYSGASMNCMGENFSYGNITSISPSSNGSQTFNAGSQVPFYAC
jgi:hypothetical protein